MQSLGVSLLAFLAGCNCRPSLPSDSGGDTEEPPPPVEETADTSPPLPCAAPEIEPNNSFDEATELPMEYVGCGAYDSPGDFDVWVFDFPLRGWLGVTVRAESLGSYADPVLVLTSPSGTAADVRVGHETRDPRLLFPASEGTYSALLSEQNIQGGTELYGYEILATQAKAPISWSENEMEPNDVSTEAQTVFSGDRLFGDFGAARDNDWFRVEIPAGKHTLRIDVDAFEFGSAADLTLFLYDSNLSPLPEGCEDIGTCGFYTGEQGWERDPVLEFVSSGDEELLIRVDEVGDRGGEPFWYLLEISVEGF